MSTTQVATTGSASHGTRLSSPAWSRRARRDSVVRRAATLALWLILLLVTYWWAAGGGFQDLTGWESGLLSAGRISALIASALLLVQVLLMARVPVLEQAFGQDRLARQHRWIGFTSFNLMLTHVALITWGYAAGRLADTPRMLWTLTWDYPGMLLAAAGTACLIMVVVTSIKAARSRLRYESWHLLHLYAYLGAGLALPHQLWTGQEFLASTWATVFWWSLWGAAVGAVMIWRVALPLYLSARHDLRVTSIRSEGGPDGEGIVSIYLTGRALDELRAEPGQFFTWRFLGRRGWTRANPFSLSAAPDGRSLRITVKDLGDGSRSLTQLRPGTRALIEGPYGRLSPRARTRHGVVLIGAGVGITPLRALAEGLDYAPGEAVLIHRFADVPLFERELAVIGAERGLKVVNVPGRRRASSWLSDQAPDMSDLAALKSWVPDLANRDVFVCGPQPWSEAVRRTALAGGVPAANIHIESFGW